MHAQISFTQSYLQITRQYSTVNTNTIDKWTRLMKGPLVCDLT